jgi:glutathione peroxidase-family protein
MKKALRTLSSVVVFFCSLFGETMTVALAEQDSKKFYNLSAETLQGNSFSFVQLKGKVVVFVNTASKCGYTSQYKELEELYKQYKSKGVLVLGFPSNDFGGQEPGTDKEIAEFCTLNFGVTFPMFAKAGVSQGKVQPVYQYLLAALPNSSIKWNFEKIVVDRTGKVLAKYASSVTPLSDEFLKTIDKALLD